MCLAASGAAGRGSVQPASAGAPVTIAFRAFTPGGEPVLDLKASDLTLKVNGRARGIASLDLVRLADDRAESGASPAPPPFTTNVLSERARTVLLILEDDSIAPGQEEPVKKALEQLLATLSPADRVALLPTARASAITAFSTDREAIRAAIAGFTGRASVRESIANVPCRTRITLEALRQMFAGLPADFPVTVVFFSAGLSGPIDSLPAMGTQPLCELRLDEFTDVADVVLSTSNFFYVAYVVEGSGLAAGYSSFLATGLETLAGAGGGDTIRVTGGNEAAMTRIARETRPTTP